MESSRKDLLNYMAEHRTILKHDQNRHYFDYVEEYPKSRACTVHLLGNLNSTLPLAITKATTFQDRQPGFHDLWGHLMLPN